MGFNYTDLLTRLNLGQYMKGVYGRVVGFYRRKSSLTVEHVLGVIGPDPVVRVMTDRGRGEGRIAGYDVEAVL